MKRVSLREMQMCVFCATTTQKALVRQLAPAVPVPVPVCVACCEDLGERAESWEFLEERDALACEYRDSSGALRCRSSATYLLWHEGLFGYGRGVLCCGDPQHIRAFEKDYGHSARLLVYAGDPPQDWPTDIRTGQERVGADPELRVGVVGISRLGGLIRVHYRVDGAQAEETGSHWMTAEQIRTTWPIVRSVDRR